MVEIADTGSGISDEDLPFIRQELYRGESACDIPGNGLGLTLVNAIVERHNGQVAICSLKTAGHRGDCAIANHIVGRPTRLYYQLLWHDGHARPGDILPMSGRPSLAVS